MVRLLLYADDLVLLAETAGKLQQLLDALQSFCSEYDMQVNVGKTEVVVFDRKRYSGAAVWQYQGQQVPVSQQFRYLGVQFHSTQGVFVCTDALAAAGSRAMWAMLARCKEHGIRSLAMQVQLFNSLVSPILCYCSEVWGPALLSQAGSGAALVSKLQNNVISRVQFTFLRTLAGRVRKSTARLLLSREFGAQPLVSLWLRAAVSMWNRVVDMDASSLLVCAMRDNLRLSTVSSSGAVWCTQLRRVLEYVHAHSQQLGDAVQRLQNFQSLDLKTIARAFDGVLYQQWQGCPVNPRDAASGHGVYSTYERWFAACSSADMLSVSPALWCPDYVSQTAGINREHLGSLTRFRLGAHDLRVCSGRWQRPPVPRSDRVCLRPGCQSEVVEDEFHMVFECPFYAPVRERFAMLFEPFGDSSQTWATIAGCHPAGDDMITFMKQAPALVAAFVHCCYLMRCHPDTDPEVLLSSQAIAQAIDDADEFFSAFSSDGLDDDELFFDVSSPYEPLVGS